MSSNRERLATSLREAGDGTIQSVIDALAAAATYNEGGDWDSETIEHVLEPLQQLLETLGYPGVGEPDDDAYEFWSSVDDAEEDECEGHPHDPADPNSVAGVSVYCDGSCVVPKYPLTRGERLGQHLIANAQAQAAEARDYSLAVGGVVVAEVEHHELRAIEDEEQGA